MPTAQIQCRSHAPWHPCSGYLMIHPWTVLIVVASRSELKTRPCKSCSWSPQLLEQTRITSTIISAWDRDTSKFYVDRRQAQLNTILHDLLFDGRQVILIPLLDELVQTLDVDTNSDVWLFSHPISSWRPFLAPVILRHGQCVGVRETAGPAVLNQVLFAKGSS